MRFFRALAGHGATVVVLHHTGKAETSKLYRGSSDIKAAVDTAYLLSSASQHPNALSPLSMTFFKARLAPGQNFSMKFVKGLGFLPNEQPGSSKTVEEAIETILEANPNSNQSELVRLGQAQGWPKGKIEACLRTGPWSRCDGPNRSILYRLRTEALDGDASRV